MPVNTASMRFGISTLTSLRLFTRAPCTRIRSWLSAAGGAAGCLSILVAILIVSICPADPPSRSAAAPGCEPVRAADGHRLLVSAGWRSCVLKQPEDVAIGIGHRGHQPAAADVA